MYSSDLHVNESLIFYEIILPKVVFVVRSQDVSQIFNVKQLMEEKIISKENKQEELTRRVDKMM